MIDILCPRVLLFLAISMFMWVTSIIKENLWWNPSGWKYKVDYALHLLQLHFFVVL